MLRLLFPGTGFDMLKTMNTKNTKPDACYSISNPALAYIENRQGIDKLLAVVAALRNPEGGCPWDLKQTHQSLRPYLLEEAYEAIEAIHQLETTSIQSSNGEGDTSHQAVCEELGDVLLQVALHSQIAQDNGHFDFSDVSQGIADKLIRRHPHVFGEASVDSAEQVTANWADIKKQEKLKQDNGKAIAQASILEKINRQQPALLQAFDTSKKAVAVGFEWPNFESLWKCVMSEYQEFLEETQAEPIDQDKLEDEFGDILFASVNLARHFKINPEVALARATQKFTKRFQQMETTLLAKDSQTPLEEQMKNLDFETWDALWEQSKRKVDPTR